MVWTTTVTNKEIVNGVAEVTLQFTDGTRTIVEKFVSTKPTSSWIPDTVMGRIAQLDVLFGYDIPLGPVTPSTLPIGDLNEGLFLRRARSLETIKIMIELGVVDASHAKVVALVNWLKANVNTYLDKLAG
jgi:hypothetical protein